MDLSGPGFILAIIAMAYGGWIITSWIRAKHGYPVEGEWGGTVHKTGAEAGRKIELLTSENEKLHGQVMRLEERIAVLERIATDAPSRLSAEIENLRKDLNDMTIPFETFAPVAALIGFVAVIGWIYTTRLRIKHGYPLDGAWGQAVYPKSNDETVERVKLLTQENAQLRAELGSIKDRLATVERIVTDEAHGLAREIEDLRSKPVN